MILQRASSHFKKGNVEIEMPMVSASNGSALSLGLAALPLGCEVLGHFPNSVLAVVPAQQSVF